MKPFRFTTWTKKKFILFFFCFFIITWTFSSLNLEGKYINKTHEIESPSQKQIIDLDITNLHRLNQELIVKASLKNNLTIGVFTPIEFTVLLYGSNPTNGNDQWVLLQNSTNQRNVTCEKKSLCDSNTLVHENYIHYTNYKTEIVIENLIDWQFYNLVEIEYNYVSKYLTYFKLFFQYILVMILITWTGIYFYKLRDVEFKNLPLEQKWLIIMLVSLIFFNNPLHPVTLLSSSLFWRTISLIFTSIFFIELFGGWLCVLGGFRTPKRHFRGFYLPKFLLLGLIFILFLSLLIWRENHSINHPKYESVTSIPSYCAFRTILTILFVYYWLWAFYSLTGSYSHVKQIKKMELKRRFMFFVIIGTIPFFFTFQVLFTILYSKDTYSPIEFMAVFFMYNFYLLGYSYACLPNKLSPNQENNTNHSENSDSKDSIGSDISNATDLKIISINSSLSDYSDQPEKKLFQKN
ncbi:transmembrane protein [Anaeramoeba flamelloides]|uniref:Transmembrane protein n=1 Tax=Anaeramoeba flamelloides TaxID=1746091 RepID=A0ABQ8Y871_9EUKA|nr:transmembrane protein [Anaeramoeba flamelloides]